MTLGFLYVVVFVFVFGLFYATPFVSVILARKHKIRLAGEQVVLLVLPIIAAVGFFRGDWATAVFGLVALAGYFLGLRHSRSKRRSAAEHPVIPGTTHKTDS